MSEIRYVTVSEMQDFLADAWRWYAKWRLNRVPRRWSEALEFGTLVHDVFEFYFSHADVPVTTEAAWEHVYDSARATPYPDPDQAAVMATALKKLIAFRPQIVAYKDAYPVEAVLGVEEAFTLPLWYDEKTGGPRPWVLRGRPDRVVLSNGKVLHQQHKTVAGNRDISLYLAVLQRSMHEGLYGTYLARKYPEYPYGGSWINLIRKAVATDSRPVKGLGFQAIVKVDEADRKRAWDRARWIVREMWRAEQVALEQGHDALPDNPGLDDGYFHNSLDGYFDVLRGKASLDDPNLFMSREDTYA